eukprot:8334539-Pyramimonas_sp.AAC.1
MAQMLQDPAWAETLREPGVMTWAERAFIFAPGPPVSLDLNAPGYEWQGHLARFLLAAFPDSRSILW